MAIRRARAPDIPALVDLERAFPTDRLSARSFRHLLQRGHADVWIYDEAGRALGNAVVLYRRGTRIARLYSLVVADTARGKGIGSALVACAERHAARRGCAELQLEVRPDNAGAQALYARRGYAGRGTLPEFYEDGAPALRLGKPLTRAMPPAPLPGRRSRRSTAAMGNAAVRTPRAAARAHRSSPAHRG